MKQINYPFALGLAILVLLMSMYAFPSLFTDIDPLYESSPKYIEVRENGQWVDKFGYNPMPPNRENLMGTDDAGRDVYARLIYGTKNTVKLVFFVALIRMALAFPLGMAAGMGFRLSSAFIQFFNTFFTAVPILIFSYIILNIAYFRHLQMDLAIIGFAVVLGVLGFAKLAGMIEDATRKVMAEDFIEGEVAIGKTKWQVAIQNVLPHIIPDAVSLFFKEMGMAMFLLAQLAVFNVFVGVAREIKQLAFKANYEMILEPEWGGTLSRIAVNMRAFDRVYWMTVFPIILFSVAITGFNLVGEGLRIEFQKRNSHVISYIRKFFYAVSPRLFFIQLKNFKANHRAILLKIGIVMAAILYFVIPWHPSVQKFDVASANGHLKVLTAPEFMGRVTGTSGGHAAGDYIIEQLMAYGYSVSEMPIEYTTEVGGRQIPKDISPVHVSSGYVTLTDASGEQRRFELYKDFAIATVDRKVFSGASNERLIYQGVVADASSGVGVKPDTALIPLTSEIPYLREYSARAKNIYKLADGSSVEYSAEFLMLPYDYESAKGAQVFNSTVLVPFDALKSALKEGAVAVEINLAYPEVPAHNGRNIMAFLPGKGSTSDDPGEVVVIGASYDGLYAGDGAKPYVMSATPVAMALEVARSIASLSEPLNKSVEFIFWDNQAEAGKNTPLSGIGTYHLVEMRDIAMSMAHGFYYVDLTYPGYEGQDRLNLTTLPAQRANGKNYLIGLEMEKRLKNMDVPYRRYHYDYAMTEPLSYLRLNAMTSIGIGNLYDTPLNGDYDTFEAIDQKRFKAMGQLLVDMLTMNEALMGKSEVSHD